MSSSIAFAATEASSPQKQSVQKEQSDWLTHATMSYTMWRQANLYDAIREGREACRLAPDNAVVLMNLALMLQATDDCDGAIACFEKAGRLDTAHYLPVLGTARCWIIKGDEAKAITILKEMSNRKNAGFDWYYWAGQTCLKVKQNDLAEKLIKSAISAAKTPVERANARNSLFLIELRGKKFEQAKELYKKVFADFPPNDAEIYVRAAAEFLKTKDTARGKELLRCAMKNLKTKQDSKAFHLLGRIFQDLASEASAKERKNLWLVLAGDAFTQAIDLAPKIPDYFLARADVLMQEGKLSDMICDLKTARGLSKADSLPSFILDNFIDESSLKTIGLKPIKIVKAKLSIEGLSCDCHLSKYLGTMRNINGVASVSATGRKVFLGELIYAPAIVSFEELVAKTQADFFKALPPKKSAEPLSVKVLEEEPLVSLKDVFKHVCETRYGPVLSFQESLVDYYNRFNDIQPSLPTSKLI
jgi:tetratricopeptide (TPR) repeat protein